MLRHLFSVALAVAALLGTAAALWLPLDLAPRVEAQAEPEPPSSELKHLAAESAMLVTMNVRELMADDLLKVAFQDVIKEIDNSIRLPLADVDRVTFAYVRGGWIRLVQTRKPYDKDKLQQAIAQGRYGRFDAPADKDGRPQKPVVQEKKVGGKVIAYMGGWNRYTDGFTALDKKTFAAGEVMALETWLGSKARASEGMTEALGQSGKQALVLGMNGKRLVKLINQEYQSMMRGGIERIEIDVPKDKGVREEKKADKKEEKKQDKEEDPFEGPGMMSLAGYRSLLEAQSILVTFDMNKGYTLKGKITGLKKDEAEDAEIVLKALLIQIRELARVLPKVDFPMEFRGLQPLADPVYKAFKAAKVERKGTTMTATVTMARDAALAKKLATSMKEETKKREEERKKGFKDGFKGIDVPPPALDKDKDKAK